MNLLSLTIIAVSVISCSSAENLRLPKKREAMDGATVRPVSSIPSSIPGVQLSNVHVVEQKNGKMTALRGNFPWTPADVAEMKGLGVERVIIFKNDKNGEVERERKLLIGQGFKKENIVHIDFDWKDNSDFKSGCHKFMSAVNLLEKSYDENATTFFHCTTGEDRTGALSSSYLKIRHPEMSIDSLFQNEMCAKGYESGEYYKPKDVVEKIRSGLSLTFLKFIYVIDETQKKGGTINDSICDYDFSNDQKFMTSQFSNTQKYNCDQKEFKNVY